VGHLQSDALSRVRAMRKLQRADKKRNVFSTVYGPKLTKFFRDVRDPTYGSLFFRFFSSVFFFKDTRT